MFEKKYKEILYMKRPKSSRTKMSMSDRAAQFAPFSALTGHKESIDEAARLVDDRIELSEDKKDELTFCFSMIMKDIKQEPEVKVVYFVPDETKKGGRYISIKKKLISYDTYKETLIFQDKSEIHLKDIIELEYK